MRCLPARAAPDDFVRVELRLSLCSWLFGVKDAGRYTLPLLYAAGVVQQSEPSSETEIEISISPSRSGQIIKDADRLF